MHFRDKFHTLIIIKKCLKKNIKNPARQTIKRTFSNIQKKKLSKNIKNCMSYHADRGGRISFEKNAFVQRECVLL